MDLRRRTRVLGGAALSLTLATLPAAIASAAVGAKTTARAPSVVLLARAGGSDDVFALACASSSGACDSLSLLAGGGTALRRVTPPPVTATPGSSTPQLTFASVLDGIALPSSFLSTTASVTTDGATTWRELTFGASLSILSFAATPTTYYAIAARCPGAALDRCTGARLLTSSTTTIDWHTTPLGNGRGIGTWGASVAAFGGRVWIAEATAQGAPRLATSTDGGRRFVMRRDPSLVAVDTCALTATSTTSVWARCPTGMDASFLHSTDAGRIWHVLRLPLTSNTGGSGFDPVAGDAGYFASGESVGAGDQLYRIHGPASTVTRVHHVPLAALFSVVFLNGAVGIAAGQPSPGSDVAAVARTADGGHHWQSIPL